MYSASSKPCQWLSITLRCYLPTLCRPVSTTSAINRGLRSTKYVDTANSPGQGEKPWIQKDNYPSSRARSSESRNNRRPSSTNRHRVDDRRGLGASPKGPLARPKRESSAHSSTEYPTEKLLSNRSREPGERPYEPRTGTPKKYADRQPRELGRYVKRLTENPSRQRFDDHSTPRLSDKPKSRREGSDKEFNYASWADGDTRSSDAARIARQQPSEDSKSTLTDKPKLVSRFVHGSKQAKLYAGFFASQQQAESDSAGQESKPVPSAAEDDKIPVAIPYTTSASTFLYGFHTVYSALKGKRRQLYRLHLWSKIDPQDPQLRDIRRTAKVQNIPITEHHHTKILNKMSEDRPHNGYVLEASRLPAPPALSLGPWDGEDGTIMLELDKQTVEDEKINGTSRTLKTNQNTKGQNLTRHPVIVLLDGITDPGNVGSILRTCYFYGVDAVAIATNTCAPLTSATLAKASSGACEAIPILALPKPSIFALNSSKAGWRLFAAVAPSASSYHPERGGLGNSNRHHTTESIAKEKPLEGSPCILMLGAEDKGLRENLRNKAADSISIESGRDSRERVDMGIDSVNVSVAAGALLESFLRPRGKAKGEGDNLGF